MWVDIVLSAYGGIIDGSLGRVRHRQGSPLLCLMRVRWIVVRGNLSRRNRPVRPGEALSELGVCVSERSDSS